MKLRLSRDVRALNPQLDPRTRRELSGQEDCADLLLDQMRIHAPDLAARFERDYKVDRWRIDLACVGAMVGVEVNGGYSNARGGKHGSDRDHRKIRMLTRAGWRVFVFTANEVRRDPLGVIRELREYVG